VPHAYETAVKYYKEAVEQGNTSGQKFLGDLYCIGKHVPQDYEKVVEYFELAVSQGNVSAQVALACLCFAGWVCLKIS